MSDTTAVSGIGAAPDRLTPILFPVAIFPSAALVLVFSPNVTTLIAGLALLVFGSGPVRGFAVVHCLGILTSIFSAVLVSRAMVNLWYGRQRKLSKLSIGQIWTPGT